MNILEEPDGTRRETKLTPDVGTQQIVEGERIYELSDEKDAEGHCVYRYTRQVPSRVTEPEAAQAPPAEKKNVKPKHRGRRR